MVAIHSVLFNWFVIVVICLRGTGLTPTWLWTWSSVLRSASSLVLWGRIAISHCYVLQIGDYTFFFQISGSFYFWDVSRIHRLDNIFPVFVFLALLLFLFVLCVCCGFRWIWPIFWFTDTVSRSFNLNLFMRLIKFLLSILRTVNLSRLLCFGFFECGIILCLFLFCAAHL